MVATVIAGWASAPAALAAPVSIDTFALWNGVSGFGPFGEPGTPTVGQTFVVPQDNPTLTGFRFAVNDYVDPDSVDFAAYVMRWGILEPTGPVLFRSGALTTTDNAGAGGFETVQVDTGALALAPGVRYVAFLSALDYFDTEQGRSAIASLFNEGNGGNLYPDGSLVFSNATAFADLTTTDWSARAGDLAFTVTFIPEPSAPLAAGVLAAIGFLRRRPSRRVGGLAAA
jgi:hypothetical protein